MFIECEKCGGVLKLNEELTYKEYFSSINIDSDLTELFDNISSMKVVFKCNNCLIEKLLDYYEFDTLFKKSIVNNIIEYKRMLIINKNIDWSSINADNGLVYCGKCKGVDLNGNCFLDIFNKCELKEIL